MANAYSSSAANTKTPDVNAKSNNPNYNEFDDTLSDVDLNQHIVDNPNVLFDYGTYTYNFALYAMSQADFKLFQVNSKERVQRYVIAQSGVTAKYSIGDVKITGIGPGSPGKTTNSSVLQIDLNITEQNGMNFMDDLIIMSNALNYKKFADVPLILELKFVGQKGDTGVMTEIPDTRKYWNVRINTIESDPSSEGGTFNHKINMVSLRNTYDNPAWILKEPFQCNTSTFGDFCQQLENKLNEMSKEQYGYLTKNPAFNDGKFFNIHVSDSLKNLGMVLDAKQDQENGADAKLSFGNRQFRFEATMNISNIIDNVIDCCAGTLPDGTVDPNNRQFVQVVPSAAYGCFDPIRNTSAYRYNYYIVPFWAYDVKEYKDLDPNVFNVNSFIRDVSRDPDGTRANSLKIPAKRYDFQFTGLNSEVLDLQMKFDSHFYVATTRNPYSVIDANNSTGTHASQTIIFNNQTFEVNANSDLSELYKVSEQVKKKQSDGKVLTESEKQFLRDSTAALATRPITEGDDDLNFLSPVAGSDVFIEDLSDTDLQELATAGLSGNYVNTIPTEPTNISETSSSSSVQNSSPYELYRRTCKSNYYNRSFLLELNMDVVGDPYWLGWSEDVYMNYLNAALVARDIEIKAESRTANYITGESYLLLNLKPSSKISDKTGIMDISDKSVFAQSFYRVLTVVSDFSGGKFTQHINGALIIRSLNKVSPQNT